MKFKYILTFFLSIVLLIGGEYIFLNEFSEAQRISILALSAIAALIAIISIFLIIHRSRIDPK